MKIKKISPQGYCNGVKYALKTVNEAILNNDTKKPIYLLGNLIHNKIVMDSLKDKGVIVINEGNTRFEMLDKIDNGTVIFSAHGVSPRVYQKAQDKGLNIIDATCPNVLIIHKKIIKYLDEGFEIIYIGTKNHPESEGVIEISDKIHFINSPDDINILSINSDKIYITNQTTLSIFDMAHFYELLKKKFPKALIDNKICLATTKRQQALLKLDGVDICIVVGDKSSSNSKKLAGVASDIANVPSYLVESAKDIDDKWFTNASCVAVTSGASTPDELTDEVIEYLKKIK